MRCRRGSRPTPAATPRRPPRRRRAPTARRSRAAWRPERKSRISQPSRAGLGTQVRVGVDRDRGADQREHRHVVDRVRVGRAAPDRSRPSAPASARTACGLGRAVQQLADQAPGVHAVVVLGDRAERAGQPEPAGDDRGQLERGRGDQPDPLPGVEVHLGERPGARPDPVGHAARRRSPRRARRSRRPPCRRRTPAPPRGCACDVLGAASPPQPERELLPDEARAGRRRRRSCARRDRLAKWKIDAPIIIVLSTSKNAAAVRSGGTLGIAGPAVSAAAAAAAPASRAARPSSTASAPASSAVAAAAEASPARWAASRSAASRRSRRSRRPTTARLLLDRRGDRPGRARSRRPP